MHPNELERYNREGYVILKKDIVLPILHRIGLDIDNVFGHQLDRYKLDNIFDLFESNPAAVIGSGKAIQNLPSVYGLMTNYGIMHNIYSLIAEPVIATKPVVFFHHSRLAKEEIYWKTPAHQDQASISKSANTVIAWIPLVDCTYDGIGPIEVIPGSHLKGAQWDRYESSFGLVDAEEGFIKLYASPGDVILFNSCLVHRSGTNTSDDIRYSISYRYADLANETWIGRDYYDPYQYKSVVENEYRPSPEEMQELFILGRAND